MKPLLKIIALTLLISGCSSTNDHPPEQKEQVCEAAKPKVVAQKPMLDFPTFERKTAFERLKNKLANGAPLTIHLRIPLCDNEHQGIVPVPASLGNGTDLRRNLYWGAKYGFKNHFRRHTDWELIKSELAISDAILERVIFKKELASGAKVFIVAEAYRGDTMEQCLVDYLHSVAGRKKEQLQLPADTLGLSSEADLLIFNGHNGLMDHHLAFVLSEDQRIRETAVIGCVSHRYFKDHLLAAKGYPLLMTTNLMAPEAYVAEALIESWLALKTGATIREEVGKAYHKYQKCGLKGATNLFCTDW